LDYAGASLCDAPTPLRVRDFFGFYDFFLSQVVCFQHHFLREIKKVTNSQDDSLIPKMFNSASCVFHPATSQSHSTSVHQRTPAPRAPLLESLPELPTDFHPRQD